MVVDVFRSPEFARHLLGSLLHLLVAARTVCRGDMDRFLILLVLGVRAAEHPQFGMARHDQVLAFGGAALPGAASSVRALSAFLGIPNETVRRKVVELIRDGYVLRDGADLHLTGRGYKELEPVREKLLEVAESYALTASSKPDS